MVVHMKGMNARHLTACGSAAAAPRASQSQPAAAARQPPTGGRRPCDPVQQPKRAAVSCNRLLGRALEESSDNGHVVTSSYCSRRSDHGVHASAGELTEIANLHPIVVNERPKNIGILG